jgi:cytoskeleton protein RodZ
MPPINVERSMTDAGSNGPILDGSEADGLNRSMPGPGAQLAAYRQERGWSIEQVASHLNLAPRQVQAIENDDYPALPPLAVLRGFVRAYAKLLKVDPAPLLAEIGGATMAATILPAPRLATRFSEPRFPSITDRRRPSGKQFFLLVLLVIGLGGAWLLWPLASSSNAPSLSSVFGKIETLWADASGSKEAAPATTVSVPMDVPSPAVPSPVPESVNDIGTQAPAAQNADPVLPAPVVPEATAPSVAPPDANAAAKSPASTDGEMLVVKANQDSWLQIRRAGSNAPIISRMVKAGETETVEIKEPLSVVIGNASGVDATLRGKPLELKAKASNNVARLSLK